jgi:hypothetical protein
LFYWCFFCSEAGAGVTRGGAANADRNGFLGERMQLAQSFDEFLEYAPRVVN